jgi:TetR/AcrR family transcriptional repressor of nem operon
LCWREALLLEWERYEAPPSLILKLFGGMTVASAEKGQNSSFRAPRLLETAVNIESAMQNINRRKEAVRRRVVEVALEKFCEHGIAGTCLREIAVASGVKHGSLFYYFESKEQIVREALIYALERELDNWKSAVGEDGSGFVTELRRQLNSRAGDNARDGSTLSALAGEMGRLPDATRREIGEKLDHLFRVLAQRLPRQRTRSSRAEVMAIYSMITGAIQLSRTVSSPEMSAEILTSTVQIAAELVGQRPLNCIFPHGAIK